MKYLVVISAVVICLATSCATEDVTGIYVCQNLKGTGVSVQDKVLDAVDSDTSCAFTQLEFTSASAVILTTRDTSFTSSYIKDNKVIKVQRPQNDLTFTIRADGTLEGEGATKGIYAKK